MTLTNNFDLPQSFVNAVDTEKHNQNGCVSATTLIRGAKEIILSNRHWDDITEDASDRVYALLGTAVHKYLEDQNDNEGVLREVEFKKQVGNKLVTGRLDRFDPSTETITDWKVTSVYKVKNSDYKEWYHQLMIYAWLLKDAGYKVSHLRINAILRDWNNSGYLKEGSMGYPAQNVVKIPFDITDSDFEYIDKFIKERVAEIERCEALADDDIPACSAKERWEKPSTWAVMPITDKKDVRAKKLCSTEEEAKKYIEDKKLKDHEVVFRQGISPKCKDYCSVCRYCNFWKENVAENNA